MNQRYKSSAVVTDGQMEPAFELDAELHYQPTTWPGARMPHAWVYDQDGGKHSTLDLVGRGQFTLLTGINGEPWVEAAAKAGAAWASTIRTHVIGPRRAIIDHHGDWARAREVNEAGCVLVRPDQHVAWRAETWPTTRRPNWTGCSHPLAPRRIGGRIMTDRPQSTFHRRKLRVPSTAAWARTSTRALPR
jgi:2,4-dichlorophenol 6-monooxygenase